MTPDTAEHPQVSVEHFEELIRRDPGSCGAAVRRVTSGGTAG
ncbi:hypothetical protein [Streptomyces deccanensis]|nr:hypothetical protein [Streptomyces deccanensis]